MNQSFEKSHEASFVNFKIEVLGDLKLEKIETISFNDHFSLNQ